MNCQDIQKFAFTYLDCEFDARDRVEFEAHLQACCTCRCAVERDAMFRDVVRRNLDGPRPDEIVRNRLQSRIACAHRSRVSRAVVVPIALAAGVTIALVGWRIMPHEGSAGEASDHAAIAGIPLSRPVQRTAEATAAQPLDAQQLMARKVEAARLDALRREALHNGLRTVHVEKAAPQQEAIGQRPPAAGFQLASNAVGEPTGEVLRGGLPSSSLVQRSPFGAVRSEESLRTMARIHLAQLPPEVTGPARKIQKYLDLRARGLGSLPLTEGAGVELQGARIGMIGAQLVVVYTYKAWGAQLTVVSRRAASHGRITDDPELEAVGPDTHAQPGVLLDRRADLNLMHVVSNDRVLTLVSELGGHALLQLTP